MCEKYLDHFSISSVLGMSIAKHTEKSTCMFSLFHCVSVSGNTRNQVAKFRGNALLIAAYPFKPISCLGVHARKIKRKALVNSDGDSAFRFNEDDDDDDRESLFFSSSSSFLTWTKRKPYMGSYFGW